MTISTLKKLVNKLIEAGVPDDAELYSEQAQSGETDCFIIARDEETGEVDHVYISDDPADELEEALKNDGYTVEFLY